mgnify:CR=1 FL=1
MSVKRAIVDADVSTLNVAEFCRLHGISTWFFYALRRRYAVEGATALEPRSRAPKRVANKTGDDLRDRVVVLRKELGDEVELLHDVHERVSPTQALAYAVMGCMAQKEGEHIATKFPWVDLIVGTRMLDEFPRLLERVREGAHTPLLAIDQKPKHITPPTHDANDPLLMFPQRRPIDTRPIIETVKMRRRGELHQVLVTGVVFGQ